MSGGRMRARAMAAMRGGVVIATLATAGYLLAKAASLEWARVTGPGPHHFDQAVTLVAALGALAAGAWLALSLLLAMLAHAPGAVGATAGRLAQRCTPALARRAASALLGAAVGASMAPGAALATNGPPRPSASAAAVKHGVVDPMAAAAPGFSAAPRSVQAEVGARLDPGGPGWTPARPAQRAAEASRLVLPPPAPTVVESVVVRRGDTLWDIARRYLGPEATDAEIAEAWPAWHLANRAVIGADPDRIRPGQVLHPPVGARRGAGSR